MLPLTVHGPRGQCPIIILPSTKFKTVPWFGQVLGQDKPLLPCAQGFKLAFKVQLQKRL